MNASDASVVETEAAQGDALEARPCRAASRLWADLMQRTFGFEVLGCPRCSGRMRLIALIEYATVIQRILGYLGLPTEIPEPRPARPPPIASEARRVFQDVDVGAFDPCS